ncbi:MAG TPA: hypothetical protein VNV25_09295 [Gemmatimonadaceae bacterium]|jgi:hypothetical protein|nr:hypothetical protein [Gemmatimonadaceae bacterium]
MPGPLLYSVNPRIKYHFVEKYGGGVHWIWCSETFDSGAAASLSPLASIPPSSNPKDLYQRLKSDANRRDRGSALIDQKRTSLINSVVRWHTDGQIDDAGKVEALATIDLVDSYEWRPLLYLIPRMGLGARLVVVPPGMRASPLGCEYQIHDLGKEEFDAIEFD